MIINQNLKISYECFQCLVSYRVFVDCRISSWQSCGVFHRYAGIRRLLAADEIEAPGHIHHLEGESAGGQWCLCGEYQRGGLDFTASVIGFALFLRHGDVAKPDPGKGGERRDGLSGYGLLYDVGLKGHAWGIAHALYSGNSHRFRVVS